MSKKYKLLIVCILSYIKSDLTFIMRKSGKRVKINQPIVF